MISTSAPQTLCTIAAFAWTRILLVSSRTSTFGARWVGPKLGSLGLPDTVHERLSLRNQHYGDAELSHSSVSWRTLSGVPIRPIISHGGHKSAPVTGGFKYYYSSWGDSDNVDSGKSSIDFFFTFSAIPLPNPHRCADGEQCVVRCAASNVAFNIMHASVMGSSVTDELRRQGQQRCLDRCTLLGYSRNNSDNDSEDSVKRLTRVLGCSNNFHRLRNVR